MTHNKFDRIDLLDMFQELWNAGVHPAQMHATLEKVQDALDPDTISEVDAVLFHNVLKRLKRASREDFDWFHKNGWTTAR